MKSTMHQPTINLGQTDSCRTMKLARYLAPFWMLILLSTLLSACSGGGPAVESLPDINTGNTDSTPNYQGPPPASDDVQQFKLNLWDNLAANNRCGACHVQGGQSPEFVRSDDINLAYSAANTVVNLSNPIDSRMVQKVLEGHNCWLSSPQACADIVQGYISGWAGSVLGGTASTIQLFPPTLIEPGSSKNFPVSSEVFANTVYPLLITYCSGCHKESAITAQSPYFASEDVDVAYLAAQAKINLDNPANSRLVLRLRNEFHNCWNDCLANSNEMENAMTELANSISITPIDPQLLHSKAIKLVDGILANSGGRHEQNVIAKWEFKTGQGNTAFDTSGVNPAMDLTLSGAVNWVGGWGLQIVNGKAQASTASSKKLHSLMAGSGEYSLEAWVIPANVTQQGPARILSYSGGTSTRNFTLGQTLYNYDVLNRSSTTDANGEPALSTDDATERLQAALQHVVVTYSPTTGRRIYINGEFTRDVDPVAGGSLSDWDDSFAFVMGNEVSSDRLWQGTLKMVALHNRVLSDVQILDNFKAGVGEKFLLLFGVSDLINVNNAFIVYEASQFDSYSYLFNQPYFISLDNNTETTSAINGIDIKGIRLAMNGQEVAVGQAYKNIDTTLNTEEYSPQTGQSLSNLGTVINLEKGPENDEFFLTFEKISNQTHAFIDATPPPIAEAADLPAVSDLGLKTFEKIHATFSAITGVSMAQTDVANTYENVKQALPTTTDISTFVSSQQMAVTQLAIEYCNALVNDNNLRQSFFPGFDFNASVHNAFVIGDRNLLTNPLYQKVFNENLTSQPTLEEVNTELNALIDRLISCDSNNSCSSDRTLSVIKASCAAAIGNAATLIQ